MILTHKNWQRQIIFEENVINTIIFENKKHFREVIAELQNQVINQKGNFFLSEDNKELTFSKNAEFIYNVLSLDINNKKIINKILIELEKIALENYEDVKNIQSELLKYFTNLVEESMYDLDFNYDIDIANILKIANFKISTEHDDVIEKFLMYCKLLTELAKVKLIVVFNISLYFTKEELCEIYKYILQNKITLLNIEQRNEESYTKLDCEKLIIFDEDYCEL